MSNYDFSKQILNFSQKRILKLNYLMCKFHILSFFMVACNLADISHCSLITCRKWFSKRVVSCLLPTLVLKLQCLYDVLFYIRTISFPFFFLFFFSVLPNFKIQPQILSGLVINITRSSYNGDNTYSLLDQRVRQCDSYNSLCTKYKRIPINHFD